MTAHAPMIPYGRQWIDASDHASIKAVLDSNFLTQGPKVGDFEKKLCEYTGSSYAIAVANGTAALHILALALGLKKGDEVITTPISFLATSNAILYAGATPVFADVDAATVCLSPKKAEKKITRKTKAIFLTHFGGQPADLKAFHALGHKHSLDIVEDAAHAFGATYKGQKIGRCVYSKAAILSFHPIKHITTGEGGAILTQDANIYRKCCELRSHGMTRDPLKLQDASQGSWYYEMQALGYNYRMTDIQAALGLSQMKKLPMFLKRRKAIAEYYRESFAGMKEVVLPPEVSGTTNAYHIFYVRLSSSHLESHRKEIFFELQRAGIGVQVHYIPIPSQPYYRDLGYSSKPFVEANTYYRQTISLPMFPALTKKQQKYVVKTFQKIVHHYSKH